jgi:thiamine biosynthesis protein ThiS
LQIIVNGQQETIAPCSIAAYIRANGLNPKSLVVEYNHKILMQNQWDVVLLKNGDTLELLNFVGGG